MIRSAGAFDPVPAGSPGARPEPPAWIVLALYVAFAAAVYLAHGPEPTLSIDHLAYFRLADEIRRDFPAGDYYRSFNSVRAYGVLLAYLHPLTGSHLVSLKVILAVLTVAYLGAFQLFMGLVTTSRAQAVILSIASALFVSFGASIWGMTDFAASLNRTIIVPGVVLLAWLFFRFIGSPWRYTLFPGLVCLAQLHLSALHVALAFAVFEALDWIFRRRLRIDRDIGALLVSAVACVGLQASFGQAGAGVVSFVSTTLNTATKTAPAIVATPDLPPPGAGKESPPPPPPPKRERLTAEEAWRIELFAFPWRNMPPTFATIATIASSFGLILLMALAGAWTAFRDGPSRPLDRIMAGFALAVVLAAYGLQTALWIARQVMSVFPVNFEEIRVINLVMLPAMYFAGRLCEHLVTVRGFAPRTATALVVAVIALQPIAVVRLLPVSWREGIVDLALAQGWIKRTDAPRVLYARTFLGLGDEGRRFYYGVRPAIDWLERNVAPGDLVLTNVNDFYATPIKTTGTFLNIVTMDPWDLQRERWAVVLDRVDRALASGNTDSVLALARELGARFAVVPWPVEGAAYRDSTFSILEVR